MKTLTVIRTAGVFVLGGLAGRELDKRWPADVRWPKPVQAAEPLQSNRPTEIMKYGFPSDSNLKVRFLVLLAATMCKVSLVRLKTAYSKNSKLSWDQLFLRRIARI